MVRRLDKCCSDIFPPPIIAVLKELFMQSVFDELCGPIKVHQQFDIRPDTLHVGLQLTSQQLTKATQFSTEAKGIGRAVRL